MTTTAEIIGKRVGFLDQGRVRFGRVLAVANGGTLIVAFDMNWSKSPKPVTVHPSDLVVVR